MKRLIYTFSIIFLLLTNFAYAIDHIKIGVIVPLTGGLASRGEDINKILPLITKSLNKLSPAYSFEFIVEDGKCGAGSAATTAAYKLINLDKVDFMIMGCSGEVLQVAPITEKNKIISFGVYSSNTEIKKIGDYVFRTFIDQETGIASYANNMKKICNNKIAMITEENAFTLSYKNFFNSKVADALVLAEDLPADTSDYTALLNKAKARKAECVFLSLMSESSLSNAVNQAHRMQLKQKLFANVMAEAPAFRKATGENSNGIYFIGTPDTKSESKEYNKLLKEFLEINPLPNYEFLLKTTYDASMAIADSVIAVGKNSEKIKEYLHTYSKNGALGKIEFDDNGDVKNLAWITKMMNSDGTFSAY